MLFIKKAPLKYHNKMFQSKSYLGIKKLNTSLIVHNLLFIIQNIMNKQFKHTLIK